MKIELKQGSLLEATAEVIVNPTNSAGTMTSQVGVVLKQAGGMMIEQAAQTHAPTVIGEAFITTAGTLPFQAIIHTPTMVHPSEPIPAKQIELAVVAALRCADDAGFTSIAMPALGTGTGQVDYATAAKIIVETIEMFRTDNTLQLVQIWLQSPEAYEIFSHDVISL